jgi:flagellin
MVLSVVSNVSALAGTHQLDRTGDAMVGSLRRLSSGYRLTRAADDAAGLGISEGLRSQIRGMTVAVRTTQDGVSVLQIADGALGDVDDLLHRMRDLSVQAANQGALNPRATAMLQKEVDQLKRQLDQIAAHTAFDGTPLLDGSYARLFQVGANAGETIGVAIGGRGRGMSTRDLGIDSVDVTTKVDIPATEQPAVSAAEGTPAPGRLTLAGDYVTPGSYQTAFTALGGTVTYDGRTFDLGSVDYTGAATAQNFIDDLNNAAVAALGTSFTPFAGSATGLIFTGATPGAGSTKSDGEALSPTYAAKSGAEGALPLLDDAITRVTSLRAELGAVTNRFQRTVDRLTGSIQDTTASDSRIRDTDMAAEMVTFSRTQILMQTGTAMLAQGEHSQQLLLKLLG